MKSLWRLVVALFLLLPLLGPRSAAADTSPDFAVTNGRFYTQASGLDEGSGKGFAVVDDDVTFWSEFKRLGGVPALGYPASNRFTWDGFTVQVTQRVVMQWRPETGEVYFVNVFDRLSELGKDGWLEVVRSTPPPFDTAPDAGLTWEQVTARHWKWLDENEAIKKVYWADPDPVAHFGLPMSYKDYGNVFVIRAQRAVFQYWQEDTAWAKKGQVTIALGGDIAKELDLFPTAAVTPVDPPTGTAAPVAIAPVSGVPVTLPTGFGYGMQVDPGSDLNRALGLTKEAGFGWVKVQLRWEELEQERGQINWGFIDNAVNATSGAGLNLMFSVVTAPRWSRPADTDWNVPGPPANLQDFAGFVGAIAARHKGKVKAYEVWNEQNLWYEWGGTGRKLNATQYVDLLRRSYQAIKAADPQAIVISGAPTPTGVNDGDVAIDDVAYLQQMYAAGLKDVSDAIGAHPSGFNNPPDDDASRKTVSSNSFKGHGSFYFRRFEELYQVMQENGDGNKKLWFTEFGWASSPNPYPEYAYAAEINEQQQADFLVRAFEMARSSGHVGTMFVWNLNYAMSAESNDRYAKKAFSILNPDWSSRPAYRALLQMPK